MPDEVKLEMTPELAERLKKMGHFRPKTVFPYVLKRYRKAIPPIPKEFWPVYMLQTEDGLTTIDDDDDSIWEKGKKQIKEGSGRLKALRRGIKGLVRVTDEDLKEISFKVDPADGLCDASIIAGMDKEVQVEICDVLYLHQMLTPEEILGLKF